MTEEETAPAVTAARKPFSERFSDIEKIAKPIIAVLSAVVGLCIFFSLDSPQRTTVLKWFNPAANLVHRMRRDDVYLKDLVKQQVAEGGHPNAELESELVSAAKYYARDAEAFEMLAMLRLKTGDLAGAADALDKAIDADPSVTSAKVVENFFNLLKALPAKRTDSQSSYVHSDDYNRALNLTSAIIDDEQAEKTPDWAAMAYYFRGNLYLMANEFDAALTAYDQSIEKKRRASPSYMGKIFVYMKKAINTNGALSPSDIAAAKNDFDQAMDIEPASYDIYVDRSFFNILINNARGSFQDASRAIEINKNAPNAYYMRGFSAIIFPDDLKIDTNIAISDFSKAIELEDISNRTISINSKDSQSNRSKTRITLAYYNMPISEDVDMKAFAHFLRGELFLKQGDEDSALKDFEMAANADDGTFADPHFALAQIYIKRNEEEKALEEDMKVLDPARRFKLNF